MTLVFGAFLLAHGLVHVLYVGQSLRIFELRPGLTWPDGAWALSWSTGGRGAHLVAAVLLALAAAGFVVSGVALAFRQPWWQAVVLSAAGVSTAAFVLLWNRRLRELGEQGLYGVLINAAILVAVVGFGWPNVAH
jgi:hypothetical protein